MKKILITGGQGFIGRQLAMYLASSALYDVTTVDFKPADVLDVLRWKSINKDVRVYMKELDDAHQLKNLYDEPEPYDLIVHLAAIPRVGVSLAYPESVLRNNVDSLIDVLGYCRTHPSTRLLFVSSSSATWADSRFNPYALSKKMGEELLDTYRATYGIKCATVRLFNVYGPGESEYGEFTTLIRACKKAIWTGQPVFIHGDGSQVRDFTHIDDVVDGLAAIIGEFGNETVRDLYELGSGDASVSVSQVVDTFVNGEPNQIVNRPPRLHDPHMTKADVSLWPKFWYPKINIIDYIKKWKEEGSPLD